MAPLACSGVAGCVSRPATINSWRRQASSTIGDTVHSSVARVVWPANATQSSRQSACCHALDQEQELRSAVEQFVTDLESTTASDQSSEAAVADLQMQLADANAKVHRDGHARTCSI